MILTRISLAKKNLANAHSFLVSSNEYCMVSLKRLTLSRRQRSVFFKKTNSKVSLRRLAPRGDAKGNGGRKATFFL